jgi:hypothetical protein
MISGITGVVKHKVLTNLLRFNSLQESFRKSVTPVFIYPSKIIAHFYTITTSKYTFYATKTPIVPTRPWSLVPIRNFIEPKPPTSVVCDQN